MDDLLALEGGSAARKWKKGSANRRRTVERNRRRRAMQDAREGRWDRQQRRKARLCMFERDMARPCQGNCYH
jgi:hypothetical protein